MFLNSSRIAKMSEASIADQYNKCLHKVSLAPEKEDVIESYIEYSHYNVFIDYQILSLRGTGKEVYIDKLVFIIQRLRIIQGF